MVVVVCFRIFLSFGRLSNSFGFVYKFIYIRYFPSPYLLTTCPPPSHHPLQFTQYSNWIKNYLQNGEEKWERGRRRRRRGRKKPQALRIVVVVFVKNVQNSNNKISKLLHDLQKFESSLVKKIIATTNRTLLKRYKIKWIQWINGI